MQVTDDGSRASLCNLLGYAEEILKEGERVISDLAKDAEMAFYEHEVTCLEGVSAPDGDDCWIRIRRLRENPTPIPPGHTWLGWPRHRTASRSSARN